MSSSPGTSGSRGRARTAGAPARAFGLSLGVHLGALGGVVAWASFFPPRGGEQRAVHIAVAAPERDRVWAEPEVEILPESEAQEETFAEPREEDLEDVMVPLERPPDPRTATEPPPLPPAELPTRWWSLVSAPSPPPERTRELPAVLPEPPSQPSSPPIAEAALIAAEPVETPPPAYPSASRRRGEEGSVLCSLTIGADGRVQSVTVLRSSGYGRLDEAARTALEGWRFLPATRGGIAVPWTMEHTITFRLRDD